VSLSSPESPGERGLFHAVASMLADRGYLFPLAAAQRQFRDAYYGMSAAALLEDLFFDAFNNYLHQNSPGERLERPERGQKGWDYQLDGTLVSHKVGQGPTQIAALWDATRTDVTHWSFSSAVLFTSSEYAPKRVSFESPSGESFTLRPIGGLPDEVIRGGQGLVAVRWQRDGSAHVLGLWEAAVSTTVREFVTFGDLWARLSSSLSQSVPANDLEVLIAPASALKQLTDLVGSSADGDGLRASAGDLRPGVYLFVRDLLQDVPVTSNNRAVLLTKHTVASLMRQSVSADLFAPLPTWFAAWAPVRPPNLYLTQRAQYDQMFSRQ
jgi:hypothetical protein